MKKIVQLLMALMKLLNGAVPGLREQNRIWRELNEELRELITTERADRRRFQEELLRLERLLNLAFGCPHRQVCPVLNPPPLLSDC